MLSMQPPLHTDLEAVTQPLQLHLDIGAQKLKDQGRMLQEQGRVELLDPPPAKKLRTDNGGYPSKPWKLRAVLGNEAVSPVPLVPALSAQILDKKETSKLIRKLNELLPLPSLQHLKRVKSLKEGDTTSIFLLLWSLDPPAPSSSSLNPPAPCTVDSSETCDIDSDLVINRLQAVGVSVESFSRQFRREMVAKFAPLTRSQFQELKLQPSYWPCNFHEDKYFESLVTSSHELWSQDSRTAQERFMLLARGSGDLGGGVVVDPSSNTIIAQGHGTKGHPLHHTVINLVDLVARSQGGGAMEHTESLNSLQYNRELVLKSVNGRVEGEEEEEEEKPTTSHNHLKRFGSIAQLSAVPKTGPYLCTGYDVYLDREPCHLCSMALIHMRTRRVFYSRPSRDGALGTSDKIHTLEGLNHRYEVYTGILHSTGDITNCC